MCSAAVRNLSSAAFSPALEPSKRATTYANVGTGLNWHGRSARQTRGRSMRRFLRTMAGLAGGVLLSALFVGLPALAATSRQTQVVLLGTGNPGITPDR